MALRDTFQTNKAGASSDKYPRYLYVEWSATQDIATNTSTISYTVYAGGTDSGSFVKAGPITVKIAGETVYSKTGRFDLYSKSKLASGTIPVVHNSDGSKSITYSINAALYSSSPNCKCSGTIILDDIPRQATLISAPNFNDEENPTITYSNPAGNSVTSLRACISLDGTNDDIVYRDVPKTDNSYTFELTDSERTVLRNATTTSNSRTVKFYLVTVIGEVQYSSNITKTLSIVNANPTLKVVTGDSNSATISLTKDRNKRFVKYFSNLQYNASATAYKGATIVNQKVVVGSKTGTGSSGTINGIDSGTFIFSATDSRGNTTSVTIEGELVEYIKLTAALSVTIPTADGKATLTISGNHYNGVFDFDSTVPNGLIVKYRQKIASGSYGDWITIPAQLNVNNHTYTANVALTGLDYMTTYTYQAKVNDALIELTTDPKPVRATPVFDWDANDFAFNVPVTVHGDIDCDTTINADDVIASSAEVGTMDVTSSLTAANATFRGAQSTYWYDQKGLQMRNNLSAYSYKVDGTTMTYDANTMLETPTVTNKNVPSTTFMFVETIFYADKLTTANRVQIAWPYVANQTPHWRNYTNGAWTNWRPIGAKQYSTSEQATGDYWTDGKPIYRRVFDVNVTTLSTDHSIGTISGISAVVNLTGTVTRTATGSSLPLSYYHSSSDRHHVKVGTGGSVTVYTTAAATVRLIVDYTKTS